MNEKKAKKGDLGLMIVSIGIILVGIVGLFFNKIIGGVTVTVGIVMLLMGYLSKNPKNT
ncbi:hypothetical protein [Tenacibaculum aiptasiae]|uniref:hypothetical protein n=1 Tax=Tenacibaculum aiptasiae TaxID=426481 RepID=UPI00232CAD61|nr:hypothetical protein [Tenacibaculum aiptasiae]